VPTKACYKASLSRPIYKVARIARQENRESENGAKLATTHRQRNGAPDKIKFFLGSNKEEPGRLALKSVLPDHSIRLIRV
jgi:hypothetical protein